MTSNDRALILDAINFRVSSLKRDVSEITKKSKDAFMPSQTTKDNWAKAIRSKNQLINELGEVAQRIENSPLDEDDSDAQ